MGGTRYIPGSHLTYVHNFDIARYQNIKGQKQVECEAGTIIIMHHGIWHGGGRNESNNPRLMFKLRIQPTVKQILLWDTDDLTEERIKSWNRPIFGATKSEVSDPIPKTLTYKNEYYDNYQQDSEDDEGSGVNINMSLIMDKLNKLANMIEVSNKNGNNGMKDIFIFVIVGIFLIFILDLIFRIGQKMTK